MSADISFLMDRMSDAMIGNQCANCQRPTLPNAVFCHHCGTQVQKRCPSCHTPNPPESVFCSKCGTRMDAPQAQPGAPLQGAPAAPPAEVICFCPRCQAANDFQSRFCYKCGLPLERAAAGIAPPQPGAPAALLGPRGERIGVPAGFWARFAAFLIDAVILSIAGEVVLRSMGIRLGELDLTFPLRPADLMPLLRANVVTAAIQAAYTVIGWSVWGTTLGKRVFNLYVLRPDGSRIGPGRALARYLLYNLSFVILLIGYLMIAFRKDKRGLHDLIADTYVVTKKR